MKLFEFQGKRIFKEYGIPVPDGTLLLPTDPTDKLVPPAVLKAQVLVGGRGKAGGIKIWDGTEPVDKLLESIFSQQLKGEKVGAVLAEEKATILQEYYLSITFKGSKATPVIIASAAGGVEIERVAKETPEKIVTMPFDPFIGPTSYQTRYIAKKIGYSDYKEFGDFINKLYRIFKDTDATLVEINPLVATPDGLLALDSKMLLDDKAEFRNRELFDRIAKEQASIEGSCYDGLQQKDTITYVPLSGSVGLISDGAGTGMLTLDLIKDAEGEAANFCEMGGITNPDVMYKAMEKVLENPNVKGLLVVLIGGFNRMDEMAEGIIRYINERGIGVPMVIRMCGTMEEAGKEMMKQAGIPTYDNLLEAVKKTVELTGGK
jgi:succinyl-CoA synthetase beta subunit